jgi:hypothetical protein
MTEQKIQTGDMEYFYPDYGDPEPEPGAKVLLLTRGHVCVTGVWNEYFLAWAPLPKRNKEKEKVVSTTWNLG